MVAAGYDVEDLVPDRDADPRRRLALPSIDPEGEVLNGEIGRTLGGFDPRSSRGIVRLVHGIDPR